MPIQDAFLARLAEGMEVPLDRLSIVSLQMQTPAKAESHLRIGKRHLQAEVRSNTPSETVPPHHASLEGLTEKV